MDTSDTSSLNSSDSSVSSSFAFTGERRKIPAKSVNTPRMNPTHCAREHVRTVRGQCRVRGEHEDEWLPTFKAPNSSNSYKTPRQRERIRVKEGRHARP